MMKNKVVENNIELNDNGRIEFSRILPRYESSMDEASHLLGLNTTFYNTLKLGPNVPVPAKIHQTNVSNVDKKRSFGGVNINLSNINLSLIHQNLMGKLQEKIRRRILPIRIMEVQKSNLKVQGCLAKVLLPKPKKRKI
ncbi:hypothetical protein CR513_21087, partial [Mucuna pruriens]